MDTSTPTALTRAVALIGGQKRLADSLGIKPPSVNEWMRKGFVPVGRCRAIERATAGQVSVHELRPDIFGPAPLTPAVIATEQAG